MRTLVAEDSRIYWSQSDEDVGSDIGVSSAEDAQGNSPHESCMSDHEVPEVSAPAVPESAVPAAATPPVPERPHVNRAPGLVLARVLDTDIFGERHVSRRGAGGPGGPKALRLAIICKECQHNNMRHHRCRKRKKTGANQFRQHEAIGFSRGLD